jgi:CHASE3 domain sensor protein
VLLRAKDAQLDFSKMWIVFSEYMTSPENTYLAEFRKAASTFENDLEEVATLVADNPDQERRIIRVSEIDAPGRLEELTQEKESGTLRSDAIDQAHAFSRQALNAMDAFVGAENRLRAQRSTRQTGLDRALIVFVALFSVLIAIALTYGTWRRSAGRASNLREPFAGPKRRTKPRTIFLQPFRTTCEIL